MSLRLDLARVEENARAAETEDLLDRATAYRDGMEPAALAIVEEELSRRGCDAARIAAHAAEGADVLRRADGVALRCSFCPRPAVSRGWAWHRMWGLLPAFPRVFRYCRSHAAGRA
jgi:hypothetical protein